MRPIKPLSSAENAEQEKQNLLSLARVDAVTSALIALIAYGLVKGDNSLDQRTIVMFKPRFGHDRRTTHHLS
jgi:hypothetical protein